MKKKLVAFAVTAAMVITSAVPAFAWTAVGSDLDTSANEIIANHETAPGGIKDTEVAGPIQAGKEFKTYVDLNRTEKSFEYVLNMKDTAVNPVTDDAVVVTLGDRDNAANEFIVSVGGESVATVKGIVEFTWTFTGDGYFDLTIDELGNTAMVEKVEDILIPSGMDEITSLALRQYSSAGIYDGEIVIYQDKAPVDIVAAEIVECDENYKELTWHGNVIVADQPVKGGYYKVNSITLDDGTVITGDDILKYADVEWKATKANGTAVNTNGASGNKMNVLTFTVEADNRYDGCFITCEISAKANTGVFDSVTVWENAEAIAVQARLAGDDRYATAMEVADQMKPAGGFQTIFVATGTNYADALSATALAAQMEAPILLVNGAHEADVINYINENSAGFASTTIYVIGGTSAVSQSFQDSLYKYAVNVERLSGDTRYDTNIEILKAYQEEKTVYGDKVKGRLGEILVASGSNYPDALSAAATNMPVLLVGDELTKNQRVFLQSIAQYNIDYTIIGGTVAVSADLMAELSEKAYTTSASIVTRIYGDDRYETNKMVMDAYMKGAYTNATGAKHVYVACGTDFADALTGGVIAAVNDSPLVLVSPTKTNYAADVVAKIADNTGYGGLIVIGGENAVSNATVQKIA